MISLVIVLIALAAFVLFILFYPTFGGFITRTDRQRYLKRASNYKERRFLNIEDSIIEYSFIDCFAHRSTKKKPNPAFQLPICRPDYSPKMKDNDVAITWFGHSSVLIRMAEKNVLFDPVFSKRCSPVAFIGPKRFTKPCTSAEDMPKIDICILTHDHYDHMDYRTIRSLDKKIKEYYVPLGCEKHLRRFGINKQKIHNMAWWQTFDLNGLFLSCVPTHHFSGRRLALSCPTLWGGWVLKDKCHQIFVSGDTGFTKCMFEMIHEKFGDMDLTLLDSSQYDPAWHPVHMYPEESVEAASILGAKLAMPYHWGAFVLSNHSWDDPPKRFLEDAEEKGISCITPKLCQTILLSKPEEAKDKWWESIG